MWRTFRERRNAAHKWIFAGAPAFLVLILTVPALRHAFNFSPLPPLGWLIAVGAGVSGVAWFEIYKAVATRRPKVV